MACSILIAARHKGCGRHVAFAAPIDPFGARRKKVAKRIILLAVASLLVLSPMSGARAESFLSKTLFEVDAGLSMPTGNLSDFYSLGFVIGATGFYPYSDRIHYGFRFAFNKWGIDDGGWRGTDIDGSVSMMEFVPQVRYIFPTAETSKMGFFAQGGIGFYRYAYDVDITYDSDTHTVDGSDFDLGLCLGGGVTLDQGGRTWLITPMYHIVFTEGDSSNYLTLTLGMAF
jgi:hypothetical protein